MSPHQLKSFRPVVTELENRVVPAVTSVKLAGGVVTAITDNAPTTVLVNQYGAYVAVRDITTNHSWAFAKATVSRVDVFGGNGADSLTSRGPANGRLVRLFGLGGNDLLIGGDGRELLNAGNGNDVIRAGGGNDSLIGNNGNDDLFGEAGNDTVNGGNGNDNLNGGADADVLIGGGGDDNLVAIDGATSDTLDPGLGYDILWTDKNGAVKDAVIGGPAAEVVNAVAGFANAGADRTLNGDRIADPTPLTGDVLETFNGRPLFGANGPSIDDIEQGALGDCWMLAGLGAVARQNPNVIRANVVDFGDGTYGVHLGTSFYRVDNDLPVAQFGNQQLNYTALGQGGSLWVAIMEKAYAHYRSPGANSYFSIEGGFTFDLYNALNLSGAGQLAFFQFGNAASLGAAIKNVFDQGKAPTIGIDFPSVGTLIPSHQYIIVGYDQNGLTGQIDNVILRNPWAIDGGTVPSGNPDDGIITISIGELYACSGYCSLEFANVPA